MIVAKRFTVYVRESQALYNSETMMMFARIISRLFQRFVSKFQTFFN